MTASLDHLNRPGALVRLRRNAWFAIAACLALRIADAGLGLDIIEPAHPLSAQPFDGCAHLQETRPCSHIASSPAF